MTDSLSDNPAISAVIPTRNRTASLARLLGSLAGQQCLPGETIIVDASDTPADEALVRTQFPALNIRIIASAPWLCRQRNLGIASASGELILLADDDIEFPPSYLAAILSYLSDHPSDGAVSGTLQEPSSRGLTAPDQERLRPTRVLWRFVFQTSVWGDISSLRDAAWTSPLRRYYASRGNTFSLAGWPLLTNASPPAFHTALYGLGGAVIRKSWLLNAPYDEHLDRSGIGDNYGVALQLPGDQPIVVLTAISYLHHRSPEQRLPSARAYALRVLALDHFMKGSSRFRAVNRLLLRWSLLGTAISFLLRGSIGRASATFSLLLQLLCGLSPYRRTSSPRARG
jgi:glycosyltransferase involved in cell wall biosynthesis